MGQNPSFLGPPQCCTAPASKEAVAAGTSGRCRGTIVWEVGGGEGGHSRVAQGFPAGQRSRQALCQGHESAEPAGAVCTLLQPPHDAKRGPGGQRHLRFPSQGDSPRHRPPTVPGGHPAPRRCSPCTWGWHGCCIGTRLRQLGVRMQQWCQPQLCWGPAGMGMGTGPGLFCLLPGSGRTWGNALLGSRAGADGHQRVSACMAQRDLAHPLPGRHLCTERAQALLPGYAHTWGKAHIGVGSESHPPSPNQPIGFISPPLMLGARGTSAMH